MRKLMAVLGLTLVCILLVSNHFWRKAYETKPFAQKAEMTPWDIQYERDFDSVLRGFYLTGDCLVSLDSGAIRTLVANDDFSDVKAGKPCRMYPNHIGRKLYVSVPPK